MYIYRPLNYIPEGIDSRDFKFNKKLFKKKTKDKRSKILGRLPKKVDHTPNMTPVKDQGSLGSCVSFACTAVKEWQERQEFLELQEKSDFDINENYFRDLSEQWLYYKCKSIDGMPDKEGTNLRSAMKVLQKQGLPTEEAWEYNSRRKGNPESWANRIAQFTRIGEYYNLKTLSHIKLALLHTPIPIGVLVFHTFHDTQGTGVVRVPKHKEPENADGGHAICLVGYDDKNQFIKFKNSWSEDWGDQGYGYLPYEYVMRYTIMAWAFEDLYQTEQNLNTIRSLVK